MGSRPWPAPGPAKHSLRAKLDRVGRELSAEGGFGRDVSRHFTIQYDGPVPREVARTALLLLEEAYDRLWRDFGRSPQHDMPVILYTRGLFDEITRSPAWVGGTYDGKIRVPVGGLQTESDARRLEPILAHELTHAFIRANVPGRLPLWFEEGLAGHFEGTPAEAALRTPARRRGRVREPRRGERGPARRAAGRRRLRRRRARRRRDGAPRRLLAAVADARPDGRRQAVPRGLSRRRRAWT